VKYILGISAFYHDSSAALIKDGEIISAVQEERFTRIKYDSGFPKQSIKYILKSNSLELNQIDKIIFYEKPFLKFERLIETYLAFAPKGIKQFCLSMPLWLREKLFQKNLILKKLKHIDQNFKNENKLLFCEHHLSHAASAFYPSPFEESLILTIDGVGEWATTTVGIGTGKKIKIIKEINFPHSLGLLYSAFTYYLGFKVNSGEYKVMGLAPYGKPIFKKKIAKNLIDIKEDGSFRLNMDYFDYATGFTMTNKKFSTLFGKNLRKSEDEELEQFHMDIAASIQSVIEDIIIKITRNLKKEYKYDNLCLAGGVALNCVANSKILKNNIFKNVWIQPASGDSGGSLGAALFCWYKFSDQSRKITLMEDSMKGSYLGPNFNNTEIKEFLIKKKINYQEIDDEPLFEKVAKELSNGKIVGWFQGKMEFGPRALGSRSILADPRPLEMQKKLNLKIKFRESFRPFAPAILEEKVNSFFKTNSISPYMLLVSEIKDEYKINEKENLDLSGMDKLYLKRSLLQATTHVDYTSRIQTVNKKTNLRFYKLIENFELITKIPILVNTSFNIRGEPIVCTPEDALNCFIGTDIDILVLENFLIYKKNQSFNIIEGYSKKFTLD
jgi:carbamoyltransferase